MATTNGTLTYFVVPIDTIDTAINLPYFEGRTLNEMPNVALPERLLDGDLYVDIFNSRKFEVDNITYTVDDVSKMFPGFPVDGDGYIRVAIYSLVFPPALNKDFINAIQDMGYAQ